jgi:hypothetical protein
MKLLRTGAERHAECMYVIRSPEVGQGGRLDDAREQ